MTDCLPHQESIIRLSCFLAVLLLMMLWEWRDPRRSLRWPRTQRWPANLTIVAVDSIVVRLVFPLVAVEAAGLAEAHRWGLFHWLNVPSELAFVASLPLLDLAIYTQHVLFHKIDWLWRLHRVHHTDLDLDVTTALRFHPLEIVLSMVIKLIVVVALGAPPTAVIFFEIILNATAMFNHGNVRLSASLDRKLRRLLVTPDMHRVHHSVRPEETDSNFGFNLSWWDQLFETYRDQPHDGHITMVIGLDEFRDRRATSLVGLLLQPFQNGRLQDVGIRE